MASLDELIGGFSAPSKMPGHAWSIPAQGCITGARLAKQPGTVCSKCYALKGRYLFPNVRKALERREAIWNSTDPAVWVGDFVAALRQKYRLKTDPADRVFRWFDSGDLRNVQMLEQIVAIAEAMPDISFWLPTREVSILRNWQTANGLKNREPPANLTIRLSAPLIDGPAAKWWPTTSTVVTESKNVTCPAPQQSNKCGSCRACWDPHVANVAYKAH